ncbi:glycosyltransferase family 2 protein [Campylobacter sp. CNRCH_2015_0814]|uniref:glycosyltransferase family 2 protein n=1 Tax=Campylobacter sp. CNRCH_2015_0814 TaxID=2911606 RepID=UPI0021E69353|nr:glycosyltransferase family 2 protein [Campylobacter sp. CNRCH_2015_0814]MCV3470531.1 glycosyltransferase family 2 protein [Campylobacter sp. CNRCH_2015_0814]
MQIGFYPEFKNEEDFVDIISRAIWYLWPLEEFIEKIYLCVNFDFDNRMILNKFPKYLDLSILKYLDKIPRKKIVLYKKIHNNYFENLQYVFLINEEYREELLNIKKESNLNFEIIRVDHNNLSYGDSFYLRFAEKIPKLYSKYKKISKNKIFELLEGLKTQKIYLFGTGPNFSYSEKYNYEDGCVIACNSMVVNQDVIKKLKPKIFVIADPIFHAGPSSYAGKFRESLISVFDLNPCPIVVPLRDYHIYSTYLPDYMIDFLVPIFFKIPSEDSSPFYFNIFDSLEVKTTNNILTLFQLPLATSLGEEIYITGCDGRPIKNNSYFWSHNKEVQINDKMQDIKIAHKGFFDIKYDDYYNKHINFLSQFFELAEKNKKRIFSLTPSYIKPLQDRIVDNIIMIDWYKKRECELSIIIPVYNVEKFIEKCIKSIENTCYLDYEILAIDDFSDDSSLQLLMKMARSNKRIKIYQNFGKKGVSGARNTGIKLSSGRAVCFLDADDTVLGNSLNIRYSILMRDEETKIVHGIIQFIDEDDNYLGIEYGKRSTVTVKDCIYGNPISFNTMMLKRDVIKLLHFDEQSSNGEDWLANFNLLKNNLNSKFVYDSISTYRVHSESTVLKNYELHENNLLAIVDKIFSDDIIKSMIDENKKEDIKSKIIRMRSISSFFMLFFKCDFYTWKDFLENTNYTDIFYDKTIDFIEKMRVSFIRTFKIHVLKTSDILSNDSLFLDKFVLLKQRYPNSKIVLDIDSIIGFNLDNTQAIRKANLCFSQKDYFGALENYKKVDISLRKYIDINIALCHILKEKCEN